MAICQVFKLLLWGIPHLWRPGCQLGPPSLYSEKMAAFMATARCFRMNSDRKHVWIAELIYPNISFGETICYYLLLSCCPDLWKNDASFYGKPRMRSPSNNGKLMKVAFGSPVYIQMSLLGTWWCRFIWVASYWMLCTGETKNLQNLHFILRRRFGTFLYSLMSLSTQKCAIEISSQNLDHLIISKSFVAGFQSAICCICLKTSKSSGSHVCHVEHWKTKVHSVTFSPADPLMVTLSVKGPWDP